MNLRNTYKALLATTALCFAVEAQASQLTNTEYDQWSNTTDAQMKALPGQINPTAATVGADVAAMLNPANGIVGDLSTYTTKVALVDQTAANVAPSVVNADPLTSLFDAAVDRLGANNPIFVDAVVRTPTNSVEGIARALAAIEFALLSTVKSNSAVLINDANQNKLDGATDMTAANATMQDRLRWLLLNW